MRPDFCVTWTEIGLTGHNVQKNLHKQEKTWNFFLPIDAPSTFLDIGQICIDHTCLAPFSGPDKGDMHTLGHLDYKYKSMTMYFEHSK